MRSICIFLGSQIGNVVTFPVAGLLCAYGFDGGWPSVFYVLGCISHFHSMFLASLISPIFTCHETLTFVFQGTFGVLWFIAWMLIASDSPEKHPRISLKEKHYIQQSLGKSVAVSRSSKVRANTKVVISSFFTHVYTSCANLYFL